MHKPKVKNSEVQRLIDLAEKEGWAIRFTNKSHIVFWPKDPSRSPVFTSSTPGDHRVSKNLRSRLRRAGLEV